MDIIIGWTVKMVRWLRRTKNSHTRWLQKEQHVFQPSIKIVRQILHHSTSQRRLYLLEPLNNHNNLHQCTSRRIREAQWWQYNNVVRKHRATRQKDNTSDAFLVWSNSRTIYTITVEPGTGEQASKYPASRNAGIDRGIWAWNSIDTNVGTIWRKHANNSVGIKSSKHATERLRRAAKVARPTLPGIRRPHAERAERVTGNGLVLWRAQEPASGGSTFPENTDTEW